VSESGTAGPTGGKTRNRTPGYVALAVASEKGCSVREVESGMSGMSGMSGREENMVRFAVEGLRFVRDVIRGEGKL